MFGFLKRKPTVPASRDVRLRAGGEVAVVGESRYQDALDRICGGKQSQGVHHECIAALIPEPTNPFDADAVAVRIEGETVGYLSRSDAQAYKAVLRRVTASGATATCYAIVTGGWRRSNGEGHFGVTLGLAAPAACLP